jgi:hypothetical protein
MDSWLRFKVRLHSKPSPAWTFYDGTVTVWAEDSERAKERALGELRRGAFRDRSKGSWVVDKVEIVG